MGVDINFELENKEAVDAAMDNLIAVTKEIEILANALSDATTRWNDSSSELEQAVMNMKVGVKRA